MTLSLAPTSNTPRFGGVNIKYNYASPTYRAPLGLPSFNPRFIESITFEVVPDTVFKGVRSQFSTTIIDEAPSAAADKLTELGRIAGNPRSTIGIGLQLYKRDALGKLLAQVVDDSGFHPSYIYTYTKLILAKGLEAQKGEPGYNIEEQDLPSKETGETHATVKRHRIASFTINNPFVRRRSGDFTVAELPGPEEIDKLGILEWTTGTGVRKDIVNVKNAKATTAPTSDGGDGDDTVDFVPEKA